MISGYLPPPDFRAPFTFEGGQMHVPVERAAVDRPEAHIDRAVNASFEEGRVIRPVMMFDGRAFIRIPTSHVASGERITVWRFIWNFDDMSAAWHRVLSYVQP